MARANVLVNNFNAGEVSELIESRSDISKYASACRILQNAIPLVEGGAKKMPGTTFAGIAANGGPLGTATTGKSRLVPFQVSTNDSAILEFFEGGIRIWQDGGLVEGGVAGLLDWNPTTVYSTLAEVLVGSYAQYSCGTATLIIQAPYGQPNTAGILIYVGVNTTDTLSVTLQGSRFQAIQILLANATASKNSQTAIQAAIRALGTLTIGARPPYTSVSLTGWQVAWLPYATIPPITTPSGSCTMTAVGQAFQASTGNTGVFPVGSTDWYQYTPPSGPIVITTPYLEADLFALDVSTQSADVLYICHPNYPPATLSMYSPVSWLYTQLSSSSPPTNQNPGQLYGTSATISTAYSGLGQYISAISVGDPCVVTLALQSQSAQPLNDGDLIYVNECAGMENFNQGLFIVSNVVLNGSGQWTFNIQPWQVSGNGSVSSLNLLTSSTAMSSDPTGQNFNATGGAGSGLVVTPVVLTSVGGSFFVTSLLIVDGGTGYNTGDAISVTINGQTLHADVGSVVGNVIDSTGYLAYTGGGFAVPVSAQFCGAGNYPACVTLYEQRLVLAGALNNPTQVSASTQDDYLDFIFDPNQEDYAFQFTLASQEVDQIRWAIGTPNSLLLGTASGVWTMYTTDGQSLSSTDVTAAKQTTTGVGNVSPQLVNDSVVWVTRSSKTVRLALYNWVTNQWDMPDLTRLNRRITIGPSEAQSGITQTAFQREPYPIFWATRADGQLLGMTFERTEQVFAWFRVVTDGIIESVACITQDNAEDQVWIVVNRTINGVAQRYVEYFMPQEIFNQLSNAFFVQCGLQWNGGAGVPITGISQANPTVVTAPNHGFSTGYVIQITDVQGMTQINQGPASAYTITVIDANHFSLNGMDSTGFSPYAGGGIATQVTNVVTGLQYIQGQCAVAVGDGAKIWEGTIPSSGIVNFPYYANLVTIGLKIKTIVEPMNPIIGNQQQTSKGKRQKISRATFSLFQSIGGKYGTDQQHLHSLNYGQGSVGSQPQLFTGNITRDLDGDWGDEDCISIVHEDPFPFTLRAVVPRLDVSEAG
jgi:hypothetical protein